MRTLFVRLVQGYQLFFGAFVGNCCRFYPSCSDYSIAVISRFGVWKGMWLTSKRLLKCHPWHPGGIDFPPEMDHNHPQ